MVGARHPEAKEGDVMYFVHFTFRAGASQVSRTANLDSFSEAVARAKKCEQDGNTCVSLQAVVLSPAFDSYSSLEANRWLTDFARVLNADINDYSNL